MFPMSKAAFNIVAAISLLASGAASANDSVASRHDIVLRSGYAFDATVIDVTEKEVILELSRFPGSRATLPKAVIAPDSLFRIEKDRASSGDAESWRRLADLAGDLGLHREKMAALARLAELDPNRAQEVEKEVAACREACSAERLGIARSLLDAGEPELARKHLSDVLENFTGCIATADARQLLERGEKDAQAERSRAAARRREREATRQANEDLALVAGLIAKGEKSAREANLLLDKPVKAAEEFSAALGLYERASRRLESLMPGGSEAQSLAPETSEEIERLRVTLRELLVGIHLDLGHVYLARGNRPAAYRHAGHAAALDPDDSGVMALRIAIETSNYPGRAHRGN